MREHGSGAGSRQPPVPSSRPPTEPPVAQPAPAVRHREPPGPYRYTPPQDTSQPDVKVVGHAASVLIKRYGPALGVVSLAVVVAVKIISRLRRR